MNESGPLAERIATAEADIHNIFHQLDSIKQEMKDIHRLAISVELIATKTQTIESKVDDIGNRLTEVESEPAKSFSHYKQVLIGAAITGGISLILAAFFGLILK